VTLNQYCLFAFVLESMLFVLIMKIVLQHNRSAIATSGRGKLSESESANNCIERVIGKREVLYVSFTKIDARVQSPRQLDHLRRQVDSDRARATICGFGRKSPGTGRDVQQMCTGVQTHGIEEGIGGQGGLSCKKMLDSCQSVVTLTFEGAQSVRLGAGQFCWR
jgi:hypothetical protein